MIKRHDPMIFAQRNRSKDREIIILCERSLQEDAEVAYSIDNF